MECRDASLECEGVKALPCHQEVIHKPMETGQVVDEEYPTVRSNLASLLVPNPDPAIGKGQKATRA